MFNHPAADWCINTIYSLGEISLPLSQMGEARLERERPTPENVSIFRGLLDLANIALTLDY